MPFFANWKALLIYLLEDKNSFTRVEDAISLSGDSISLTFEKPYLDSKTKIEAITLDTGELITLRFSNPIVPGYNEFSFGEYFYSFQFQTPSGYGPPGLEYNEINISGIQSILREGVKGKEVQYFKGDVILKSEVHFDINNRVFKYKYDFTDRSLWKRLFRKKIDSLDGVVVREINLSDYFPPLLVE